MFDSGRELFPSLSGEQWYLTRGFKEMAFLWGSETAVLGGHGGN